MTIPQNCTWVGGIAPDDDWSDACDPVPKKTPMKIRTAAEMARLRRRLKRRFNHEPQISKDAVSAAFIDRDFDEVE